MKLMIYDIFIFIFILFFFFENMQSTLRSYLGNDSQLLPQAVVQYIEQLSHLFPTRNMTLKDFIIREFSKFKSQYLDKITPFRHQNVTQYSSYLNSRKHSDYHEIDKNHDLALRYGQYDKAFLLHEFLRNFNSEPKIFNKHLKTCKENGINLDIKNRRVYTTS